MGSNPIASAMFKNLKDFQEHLKKMKDPEYKAIFIKKKKEEDINNWNNLDFNDYYTKDGCIELPDLPRLDNDEWDNLFVPILIKKGAIPKKDLEDGIWYFGDYRNSNIGKWNKKEQKFYILRYKFNWRWDQCNHFEDDDGYALFIPLRKANSEEVNRQEKIIKYI